ncbi:GNAT family N-acetyltransferase [Vibrio porteresiae]|uniref:GNAT family N-acetyltransferase n=1 Tax=Vibrio porteresiae DSM 19223 TaxID=1123496 RepID=A0ABZ0QKV3_9VIBR|nr:GNAT family N-acetyltransferase [Vibrio porteresiae]WPC76425.1 GNAT family N-acetyltransferase [Vibrio porteresiae DSM 19223]
MTFSVIQVVPSQAKSIAPLFNEYRVFHQQESDLSQAEQYLTARLMKQESILFVATTPTKEPLGFVQLYPTYSSITAGRILLLSDLFVSPKARRQGVATALLQRIKDHAADVHAQRIVLMSDKCRCAGVHELCSKLNYQPNSELLCFSSAVA